MWQVSEAKRIGVEVSYNILFGLALKVFYLPRQQTEIIQTCRGLCMAFRPHRFWKYGTGPLVGSILIRRRAFPHGLLAAGVSDFLWRSAQKL